MIAVLIGCGLRRAEAAALKLEDIQHREGHWVIADLNGKGGHIRTVPMPDWVKRAIDEWIVPAGLTSGPLFRAINKAGRTWGNGFTPKVIWSIVREGAANCGLTGLAPHDLRRTCARLRQEVSSNKSSSSSGTFPSKPLSATWAASSAFKMR
jgi:integrase